MKKQSKPMKKKQGTSNLPKDWLYLCENSLELSEVKAALEEAYVTEYWEEAGVLEVELEESSVDFETAVMERADEATQSYLQAHGIQTVFLVTIVPEQFSEAERMMRELMEKKGGFFCGDTQDFMPCVKIKL